VINNVPSVHVLDDEPDVHVHWETTIVVDNIRRRAVTHNLQFTHDLLAHRRLGIHKNELLVR